MNLLGFRKEVELSFETLDWLISHACYPFHVVMISSHKRGLCADGGCLPHPARKSNQSREPFRNFVIKICH